MVSIIVPVYNASKYLQECIDSLIHQTYQDIEIILIDDGSKDNSLDICHHYASLDQRIKVIGKNNEGVSLTRNLGLKEANGEYIMFVDADDYLNQDYIEHLMNYTDISDVVLSKFDIQYEDLTQQRNYKYYATTNCINHEQFLKDCINEYIYTYTCWGKIYKKALIGNSQFQNISYSEDALFTREVLNKASSIQLIDESGYHYRINAQSLTNNKKKVVDKIGGEVLLAIETYDLVKNNHDLEVKQRNVLNDKIQTFIRVAVKYPIANKIVCLDILNRINKEYNSYMSLIYRILMIAAYIKCKI